tara:strand:+ start:708 stop:1322 length:615 start_codon:yes stop_codon:yes gene_type:complete
MPKFYVPKERLIELFPKTRIKFRDIFNLTQFYKDLHFYLMELDWKDEEEGLDHWESYYGERIDNEGLKEMWIQWRPTKMAEHGKFRYHIDYYMHIITMKKIEVVKDGKKLSVNKGEIEVNVRAYIDKLFIKDIEGSSILRPFKKLFYKRIYHHEVEQRKKELYQEVYAMMNWMKQWFKLKRYLPYEESKNFYKSKSWPSHLKEQ